MDRKIPKDILRKEKRKRWIKYGTIILASIVVCIVIISLLKDVNIQHNVYRLIG